jgi:hypothetical protein
MQNIFKNSRNTAIHLIQIRNKKIKNRIWMAKMIINKMDKKILIQECSNYKIFFKISCPFPHHIIN